MPHKAFTYRELYFRSTVCPPQNVNPSVIPDFLKSTGNAVSFRVVFLTICTARLKSCMSVCSLQLLRLAPMQHPYFFLVPKLLAPLGCPSQFALHPEIAPGPSLRSLIRANAIGEGDGT